MSPLLPRTLISPFSSHDFYLPIFTMVGMSEIDILDIGMGGKMLALVCWNLMHFLCFCAGKQCVYIH